MTKRGRVKSAYQYKSWEIFAFKCVKMRNITFCVGIKRRKLDEHRSEIFVSDHHYCAGPDCRGRSDCRTELIYL
ncbi:hypothetical protein HMPREF3207_04657 [Citrobacter koseri]|nr:hypothetical protein HMPREF3207_04657 [Citrobacter koseri]